MKRDAIRYTPRWARVAYASRRSGWYPDRGRRIRELREWQSSRKAFPDPCTYQLGQTASGKATLAALAGLVVGREG